MEKPRWLKNLHLISRITSIVMVIVYSFFFLVAIALYNRISIPDFVFFVVVGSIYIIGVLISFFKEGVGALIILGFMVFFVVKDIFGMSITDDYLILTLLSTPGILNILSWYYHKEFNKNLS